MITKAEPARISKAGGIRFDVLEKDFCIGWLLKGIAEEPVLSDRFIFKGGTALRKCYFKDYRFSEDLDFTALRTLKTDDLDRSFSGLCERASAESGIDFQLIDFKTTRPVTGEEAFEARISFHGPSRPKNIRPVIRIDISFYEKVLKPPPRREIIHPYSDAFSSYVSVYALEEILAEKLRAILQQRSRIPRPRDYYDAWMLTTMRSDKIRAGEIRGLFSEKCRFKNVAYGSPEDFFDAGLLEKNRGAWAASIGKQVTSLPDFDTVVSDLKIQIERLFKTR